MTFNHFFFLGTIVATVFVGCGDAVSHENKPSENTHLTTTTTVASAVHLLPATDFEAAFKKAPNAVLIDVRTPEEFAAGALPNAINIDYKAADFKDKMGQLDKTKPVFLYCAKGGRSADAATVCKEIGFSEIYDMEGGYTAWSAAGH